MKLFTLLLATHNPNNNSTCTADTTPHLHRTLLVARSFEFHGHTFHKMHWHNEHMSCNPRLPSHCNVCTYHRWRSILLTMMTFFFWQKKREGFLTKNEKNVLGVLYQRRSNKRRRVQFFNKERCYLLCMQSKMPHFSFIYYGGSRLKGVVRRMLFWFGTFWIVTLDVCFSPKSKY